MLCSVIDAISVVCLRSFVKPRRIKKKKSRHQNRERWIIQVFREEEADGIVFVHINVLFSLVSCVCLCSLWV